MNLLAADPRKAARRAVRKQLAECERSQIHVNEFDQQLKALDTRADQAADKHRQQTEHVQSELADIEERVVAAMADRVPVDPALEQRRVELLRVIADANAELSLQIAGIDRQREPIQEQLRKARSETTDWQMLRNKLAQAPAANPALLVEHFVAQQRAAAMGAWQHNARLTFDRIESEFGAAKQRQARGAKEVKLLETLEGRFARWNATLLAAAQEHYDATQDCDRIYREMLEE